MKQTIIGALAALTLAAPAAYLPTAFADPAPIAPTPTESETPWPSETPSVEPSAEPPETPKSPGATPIAILAVTGWLILRKEN